MDLKERNRHLARIQKEYAQVYSAMKWLTPESAARADQQRCELISDIFSRPDSPGGWRFAGTKLFTHSLSPGCTLCGEGKWSCLFINGVCNANCFYCPSEQKDKGLPITSSVEFETPRDFSDYVNQFNIQGVGFSGGEPLLSLDRVLAYLDALGKSVTPPGHTWMYTNGLLVTEDRLKALRDQGLQEIRFDLSANTYKLDSLVKAVGIIPVVTVEIPAVPEDLEITKPLLKTLADSGVNFLNLHQIRCTQFNAPKLIQRGYTFIPGPGVTVLETELAALTLIRHAVDNQIPLPINYCSFTFRNQFQKAAARKRLSNLVKKGWEDITQSGYIRTLGLSGSKDGISRCVRHFKSRGQQGEDWQLSQKGDVLFFPERLWPGTDFSGLTLKVKYSATALRSAPSLRYPFTTIQLNDDKKVVIERDDRHPGVLLTDEQIKDFAASFLGRGDSAPRAGQTDLPRAAYKEIEGFEIFSPGLVPYV